MQINNVKNNQPNFKAQFIHKPIAFSNTFGFFFSKMNEIGPKLEDEFAKVVPDYKEHVLVPIDYNEPEGTMIFGLRDEAVKDLDKGTVTAEYPYDSNTFGVSNLKKIFFDLKTKLNRN